MKIFLQQEIKGAFAGQVEISQQAKQQSLSRTHGRVKLVIKVKLRRTIKLAGSGVQPTTSESTSQNLTNSP